MVHSIMRPMTIAAAAALVASSVRASFNPVYADETEEQSGLDHGHRASLFPHLADKSEIKPEEVKSKFRREANSRNHNHANTRSVIAPEEDLFPGLAYVAIAGLTGSLAARQGGTLLKALSPVAFASAAGYYFLPHTTRNLLGVDQPSYDRWASSHVSSSSSHSSTSALPRADLAYKAREAWHTAEVKSDKIDTKIDNKTQEVKHIAEDSIKTQVNDAKAKATDAIGNAKGWVEDKSRLVGRTIGNASASIPSGSGSPSLKSETEKSWFHHDQNRHPESTTRTSKYWFSTRSGTAGVGAAGAASGPESHDHWSTGEEQGTSKVREDDGYWFRQAGFNSSGGLDNKDVDVWSSTKEEMGTSRVGESPYANSHRNIFISSHLPHETEYWTNGQEISSADIRDASYYNWPGSLNSASLGRSSWWDRRFRSSPGDLDASVSIKPSTESIAWESKQAAERAALDLANRLAQEQSNLEKKVFDTRTRAEAAARQAKVTSDALIHERQVSMERSAKELEKRFATEKAAADRAVADAKARAQAWELEQRTLAEQTAREVQERVLREKAEADAAAREAKARAEAMLLEKKRHAELAAKEMKQKLSAERAEAEALAAKNRAESNLAERKRAAELSARESSSSISREHSADIEREARLRSQLDGLKAEMRDNASSSSSSSSWSWPWSQSSTTTTTSTTSTKHTHDHSHDGFDTTGHLMEHIVEDIKQTKDDISDGLHNLKDAVLGAEAKAAEATTKTKESIVGAVNAAMPERRSWWSSGSSSSTSSPDITTKISELGTGIEHVATKAERDVNAKTEAVGRDMSETARKAYDNVIDAAVTAEGQRVYTHHHHEHQGSANGRDDHNLMDHIRDDLQTTKENLQSGIDSLKETIFGAEQTANKAASEIQDGVKQAKDEGRRWWSAKTHETEKSANRLESELHAGLNKAGDKIQEFDESLNNVPADREAASDDDYWFHAEQARQQKSRRGSGRAM
ncbi:hypothetical protein KI688_002605 [Linnemannia hyalina]|uniref:MICOS complex subunit n=1 Tax=Linnemannia hyalina TaxID=64524 RepID=A0A9P7XT67_9FUNG|nr:hypothetical protein KI688_002605 [Linnemannia hyalina]